MHESIQKAKEDKILIDDYLATLKLGRLSYLLQAKDVYKRLIDLLNGQDNAHSRVLLNVILRHRFYVEYKAKEI